MTDEHTESQLRTLHDAVLHRIEVHWEEGRAVLVFGVTSPRRLIVENTRALEFTRAMPWGPSASINSARLELLPDGLVLEIQMQSGDMVTIRGTSARFEAP